MRVRRGLDMRARAFGITRHNRPPSTCIPNANQSTGRGTSCLARDRSAQTCRSLGVLGGEFCLVCELLNGGIEGGVSRSEGWRCLGIDAQVQCLESRSEDACLNLGEKQCHPAALRSQGVTEFAANRLDETLTLESAQVVAHLAGGVIGVWYPQQLGHQRA